MLEDVKKAMMASLGAVFLTRQKVEEITRKLVDEAKLSPEEAQRLTEELIGTGERQWGEVEKSFSKAMQRGLATMQVASRSEVGDLRAKIEDLEKRVSSLEEGTSG
jgi:poly(hydroxyalkanoate) granule-associated protein